MTATNRLIIWNRHEKRGCVWLSLWEDKKPSDWKLPGKHRACKSWWSRKWRSRCHRFAPRRGCSPTLNHKASLAGRPAWSPARPHLWRTYHSARNKDPSERETHFLDLSLALNETHTWRASGQLEGRFESCCCDWFAFRRPWLFFQKPV